MQLAAACTNGKLLPNMERMEPFNVIYQTAEDGPVSYTHLWCGWGGGSTASRPTASA